MAVIVVLLTKYFDHEKACRPSETHHVDGLRVWIVQPNGLGTNPGRGHWIRGNV